MEFGGIYNYDSATASGAITTGGWTTVTAFDKNAPYNKVVPNEGVDSLEAINDRGIYFAFCQVTFIGEANQEYKFALLKDGADTGYHTSRGFATTGTYDSITLGGLVELNANDQLALGVYNVGGLTGTTLTIKSAQLIAFRTDAQG